MIYVLGSLNMDMVARVSRMPAAGETMYADAFYTNCGGKGANQAAAVAKLGGIVSMIGCVGSDAFGKQMKDNLKNYGADVSNIVETEGESGIAFITVEGGDNRIIINGGANLKLESKLIDAALEKAKSGDILIAQLESPLDMIEYALKAAKGKGMITMLNPAPAAELSAGLLANVDIISPNETETEILTGIRPNSEAHAVLAVKAFYKHNIKNVIITMGSKGAAVSAANNITYISPRKVTPIDTTAAGDTFVGAVCVCLDRGMDIVSACRFASVASSVTITRKGAAISIPTIKEVEDIIKAEGISI